MCWDRQGACPACLFSLPLVGEACLSGHLSVRSGTRHYTQKFVCNCRDLVFLLCSATLSVIPTETALGFCLSWHISTLRNIPAVPVTSCPPVTMLRWGTLTHRVLHTSSQVRFLSEMPRAKLSHLSSWHAGSHKLWAHPPASPPKTNNNPITEQPTGHSSQQQDGFKPGSSITEDYTQVSHFSCLLTETIIAPAVKKKQYLWGILVSIAYLHVLLCN